MAGDADDTGRNKRTVVLPNPAGRRASVEAPGRFTPPPAWQNPAVADDWTRAPAPPFGGPREPPPQAAAFAQTPGGGSDVPADASALLRSEAALNSNEMLRAAAPMLLTLGKLRAGLFQAQSAQIMEEVARAIAAFGAAVTTSGYSADQGDVARYALAATADDVVQNIPVDDRRLWTQYSMLSQFFGERTGGVRFFEELGRMRADPLANIDVLELMYACLAVGFEGVHRTSPTGMATLQKIQRDLYDVIRRVRPRESFELSPRWQGSGLAPVDRRNRVPLWVAAAFGLVLVLVAFVALRTLLSGQSAAVADELIALYPLAPVTLVRPDYAPAPPPQLPDAPAPAPLPVDLVVEAPPLPPAGERVRQGLEAELAAGRIDLTDDGGALRLTIGDREGVTLFASGRATISEAYLPVVAQLGQILNDLPGPITVVGHTDSVPTRGVRFASNYELSVARAETVAREITDRLTDPSRVTALGKGDNVPAADNRTADGRARNRRVDIIVGEVD